jgi:hypothetical protein
MRSDIAKTILNDHLRLGRNKPVSYLPIRTVESVLGLSVGEYLTFIEQAGFHCVILPAGESCIESGSVHAYSAPALADLLIGHAAVLSQHDWPTSPELFVRRIGARWLESGHPVLPVVQMAFGD